MLGTWQQGLGTYEDPLLAPAYNRSLLVEMAYDLPILGGWQVKGAAALDHGQLLGDNFGLQLTLRKTIGLK